MHEQVKKIVTPRRGISFIANNRVRRRRARIMMIAGRIERSEIGRRASVVPEAQASEKTEKHLQIDEKNGRGARRKWADRLF